MNAVTLDSGEMEATFVPELGMVGVSVRVRGAEVLALPGGLEAYRRGFVTGLPLLAPWANRLGQWQYVVDDVAVDLTGLDLNTDEHGLPIHGTMTAHPGWRVVDRSERTLSASLDTGDDPRLLAAFPFPHRLTMEVSVEQAALTVGTTLEATSDRAVPVAFGFHPYLALPGVGRSRTRVELPARHHLLLDERSLPTGERRAEGAEEEPLGDRVFDDLYELGVDRRLAIAGPRRATVVTFGEGCRYAQVFAPAGSDFVCLEPMTAPTNALVTGDCQRVRPGGSFSAVFSLSIDERG